MFQPPKETLGDGVTGPVTGAAAPASDGAAGAGRFQLGPPIEKLLTVPGGLDGLTPLQAADCFLKSEEFYVERCLRVASEMETRLRFHIKLEKSILNEAELAPLFLNLRQIYAFNAKFYSELLKLRLHGDLVQSMGQCLIKHIPFFKLYAGYIKEYRKAQLFCDVLTTKKKKFSEWLDLNELCAGYSLKTLLLAPTARLPQYLLFASAVVRSLDPDCQATRSLLLAITALSKVSDDIAFGLKDEVSRKLVVTIQSRIFGNNVSLVASHRFVVKHGDLKKMYTKSFFAGSSKIYLFILMNDCLVYGTRQGTFTSGTLKHVLPLAGMSIHEEGDDVKKKVKNGFAVKSNLKSFVLCAMNGPTKQAWMQAIREQITLADASASTLQKGQQAADEFERAIKTKPGRAPEDQQSSPPSFQRPASASQVSTAQVRTMIPIKSSAPPPLSSSSSSSHSHSSHNLLSFPPPSAPPAPEPRPSFMMPPPPPADDSCSYPPPAPSSYSQPPPPAPSRYSQPPPPAPSGFNPPPGQVGPPPPGPKRPSFHVPAPSAPPPPPTSGYGSQAYEDAAANYASYDDLPPAPTLEYDLPSPPPSAPSAPSAPAAPAAPKIDLFSQIQAGKQLRNAASAEPQWMQILDPSSGAYYYEHRVTHESTWDPPDSFTPAEAPTGGQGMEDKLKQTLDRYRAFVQDEEDDVGEVEADEWD